MEECFGQSKSAVAPSAVGELAPGGFLKHVCEALGMGPVVVVSPSLSGMYSLPFFFQHEALVQAYIPVAPICTEKFTAEQYISIQTPSLIVYGDQDAQLKEVSLNNLRKLANHKVVVMHAIWTTQPRGTRLSLTFSPIQQGSPTLFLESYRPVSFHSNPELQLTWFSLSTSRLLESGVPCY
uniref:Abhydrolase domain containing 14B n=1 Tax=Hucho hucho TaxID=62062 RepID=A0A4W5NUM9_9TELE